MRLEKHNELVICNFPACGTPYIPLFISKYTYDIRGTRVVPGIL
eukprot:CAMPEP_0202477284 /NCGR_PEP_ID=MMETSP1360-20130828/93865_1 /ASSEMBLY_ACC=CAM_ASM_000848 /TAXON_ID=515479 /ORGANISM="Licmophora paradoxa, Strain CCMP2313" /LENGTH=43 /DNA_ID= /DNA_START= /DNA_END= /DNA_ORIENTATION=